MNWSSVILGHLCFRGQDFTVKGQSPPLQAVWSLEPLTLHSWCFWTRLQSMQDPLIPGGLAKYREILLTSVRISSSLYFGDVLCHTASSLLVILVPYSTVYRTTRFHLLLRVWQLLFWCMRRRWFPSTDSHPGCSRGHFCSTRSLVSTETNLQLKHTEPQHHTGCRQRCH